jgi:hypothetical protein
MGKFLILWWSPWSRCFGASGLLSSGRCGRSKKLGMMGEDRSASHFYLLSVLGHQPVEIKGGKLTIKLKSTKWLKYRKGTYNVIGDFMFRIDHILWYIWADTLNRCSFHSSHRLLYDWVMKRAGTQANRSISVVSASGWSWAIWFTQVHWLLSPSAWLHQHNKV